MRIPFDALLCAVGRVANTEGYGLEELGIPVTKQRTVEMNEYLQTIYPNIYACGDVAGPVPVHAHRGAHGLVLRRSTRCSARSGSSRPTTR